MYSTEPSRMVTSHRAVSDESLAFSTLAIAHQSERRLEVDIHQTTDAFANSILRAACEDVPTVAIGMCRVVTNTSAMTHPEITARLGKVRFEADPRQVEAMPEPSLCACYRPPSEVAGGYDHAYQPSACPLCTTTFRLRVRSTDLENVTEPRVVTECDLEYVAGPKGVVPFVLSIGGTPAPSSIMELPPGAEIELEAFAWKGVGRIHSNFRATRTESMRALETALSKTPADEKSRAEQDRPCNACLGIGEGDETPPPSDIKCLRLAIDTHAPHRAADVFAAAVDALALRTREVAVAASATIDRQRADLDPARSESFRQFDIDV